MIPCDMVELVKDVASFLQGSYKVLKCPLSELTFFLFQMGVLFNCPVD